MKNFYPLVAFVFTAFFTFNVYGISNDTPCNADSTLTFSTGGCNSISSGTPIFRSNIGATWSNANQSFSGCKGGSSNVPVADAWFKIKPSEKNLLIELGPGMIPNIAQIQYTIYQATGNCNALMPIQCKKSLTSTLSDTVYGLIPYTSYYIQVSGANINDQGNFTIALYNSSFCNNCILNAHLDIKPTSGGGSFLPGTEVQVCVSVVGHNPLALNWLHGVSFQFGNGWDMSSFQNITPPYSVSGTGEWKHYNAITIFGNNYFGYFFEPYLSFDNNPANNSGDPGNINSIWFFCFKLKTKTDVTCNAINDNLNIFVDLLNDGQTGLAAPSNGCPQLGTKLSFLGKRNCCGAPLNLTVTNTSCKGECDGRVTLTHSSNNPTFALYNNVGTPIPNGTTQPFKDTTLCAGDYTLFMQSQGCSSAIPFTIKINDTIIAYQTAWGCVDEEKNEAFAAPGYTGMALINRAPYLYEWESLPPFPYYFNSFNVNTTAVNMPGAVYQVRVKDKNGCVAEKEILIFGKPKDITKLIYPQKIFCKNAPPVLPQTSSPGGGTFSSSPPGLQIDPSSGEIHPQLSAPNTYVVTYNSESSVNKCGNTDTVSITILPDPPKPVLTKSSISYCVNAADTLFASSAQGTYIVWENFQGDSLGTGNWFMPTYTLPGQYIIYVVAVEASTGCKSIRAIANVNVLEGVSLNLDKNIEICKGYIAEIPISGAFSEAVFSPQAWVFEYSANLIQVAPDQSNWFYVSATHSNGCKGIDSTYFTVLTDANCELKIYSGFTPNKDKTNDSWIIDGISEYPENTVEIFNRWGTSVWKTAGYDNKNQVWKGQNTQQKDLPAGTYFYLVDIKTKKYKGWVELTR